MPNFNIKWKDQNLPDYMLNAENLHEIHPPLNTLDAPFLLATAKRELTMKANTAIKLINDGTHKVFAVGENDVAFAVNDSILDTGTLAAGKDYYVYLVDGEDGTSSIVLSLASTYPAGEDADTSRKIGGFHTLCANVGTIAGHTLSGYSAGDVLPASVWCLNHRPRSNPEGMVYDSGSGIWADIYLGSVADGELVSVNGGTCADGASTAKFHWYKFDQWLRRIKKRFPLQGEFVALSLGANQGTNIAGSADPGTTGGHSDTAGRRMISDIGCEDCCGALYQWGLEGGATNDVGSEWADAFDANDSGVAGQHYEAPNRPRFGGYWAAGSDCGSRCSLWSYSPLYLSSYVGVRGVAEPQNA